MKGGQPLLALAYNHNETIGQRVNLWVALSTDEGDTWHKVRPFCCGGPGGRGGGGGGLVWSCGLATATCLPSSLAMGDGITDCSLLFQVVELEGIPDDDMMHHYPTMAQSGCRLLVAYSSFYRPTPRCAASNPVCPPEPPRGQSGIRLAEIDLRKVDLSSATVIPRYELPDNLNVNIRLMLSV